MNIGIIGTGRLGLSFALLCAQNGYNVLGSDKNQEYVQSLNDRTFRTTEPGIEEILQLTDNFRATLSNKEVLSHADVIFLFVPTPSKNTGEYDHQYIEQVVNDILSYQQDIDMSTKHLIIGCTVMPGYTKTVQEQLSSLGIQVAYNPEFIAQGNIIHGLQFADMVLVGTDSTKTLAILYEIYGNIMEKTANVHAMSPTAAEITKIGINCFLTTKISFANMIGEIAINTGIEDEVNTILSAIGEDSRIGSKYLNYGYGYGGVCLPRDNRALGVHAAKVTANSIIPRTIDTFNQFHRFYLKDYYISKNSDKSVPFVMNQISYKKGVSILTESQQYFLCQDLLSAGYTVVINEIPEVVSQLKKELDSYGERVIYNSVIKGYTIDI